MRLHELSIAESVVQIASRQADGRQVTKVRMKVGHLRQVVPSDLAFSFELVADGVVVSGEDYDDMLMELSGPVRVAVEEAVKLVESLVEEINGEGDKVRPGR